MVRIHVVRQLYASASRAACCRSLSTLRLLVHHSLPSERGAIGNVYGVHPGSDHVHGRRIRHPPGVRGGFVR